VLPLAVSAFPIFNAALFSALLLVALKNGAPRGATAWPTGSNWRRIQAEKLTATPFFLK
jgi:hypothetical protein